MEIKLFHLVGNSAPGGCCHSVGCDGRPFLLPWFQAQVTDEGAAESPRMGTWCGLCLCQGAQPPKTVPGRGGSPDPNFLCHGLPPTAETRRPACFPEDSDGAGSISQQTPAFITPASPEMNLSLFFFFSPSPQNQPIHTDP